MVIQQIRNACELAEKLNIRNLLLYHTEDKNLDARKKLYLEEGSCYYHGHLFIPDDLESLGIDGIDYQILIEADYIANAAENGYSQENITNFINKIMKTESGKRIARTVFCL